MPEPDRWKRVEELFHEALEVPDSERRAWLNFRTAGDAELRAEVWSLLQAEEAAEAKLDAAVGRAAGKLTASEVGASIGPYKLIREIGRGGMGAVYLAQRTTGDFRQNVALKLAPEGASSSFILSRFRHERRILAGLNHPHIARLYDGGADASGRPYFAMEYVEGRPLLHDAEQRHLTIAQRVDLFIEVCTAVEYAHQRMVIHRDLKPANILVTAEGSPKLLDFGIAKLMDPEHTAESLGSSIALTQAEMRLMTPEYASPEQVRGEAVSAATDVYALGAVLFELLTGAKAQRLTLATAVELERVICQTEVERPSTRAGAIVDRDLDHIVLKAMRKEPAERYPAVSEMAADLRRWREGRPVMARHGAWSYRASKFVRRNRLALATALIVTIAVAGGVLSTVREKRIAERRFQQVRNLANTFLFEVNDRLSDVPGTTAVRQKLVETALTYLNSLAPEASGDTELTYEIASAYQRVGNIQASLDMGGLSRMHDAMASWQRAASLTEGLVRAHPREARFQRLLSYLRLSLGRTRDVLGEPGVLDELHGALASFERTDQLEPRNVSTMSGLFSNHNVIGDWELARGRPTEALVSFHKARQISREMLTAKLPRSELGPVSAGIRIGDAYWSLGQMADAETAYRECERVLANAPPNSRGALEWKIAVAAQSAFVLATARPYNLGRQKDAEAALRPAVTLAQGNMEHDPEDRRFQELFLWVAIPLSRLYSPQESLQLARRALPIATSLERQTPDNLDFQREHAAVLESMSDAESRMGMPEQAAAHLDQAVKLREAVLRQAPRAVHHLDLLLARIDQARLRKSSREVGEARAEAARLAAEYPEYKPFAVLVNCCRD